MYCDVLECCNETPCSEHNQEELMYEVDSLSTVWSGFVSLNSECEEAKHHNGCTHFRQFEHHKNGFVFYSTKMWFDKTCAFWQKRDKCNLCGDEIENMDSEVINRMDTCTFHEFCLRYCLHRNCPDKCPGCDPNICHACWECSY